MGAQCQTRRSKRLGRLKEALKIFWKLSKSFLTGASDCFDTRLNWDSGNCVTWLGPLLFEVFPST